MCTDTIYSTPSNQYGPRRAILCLHDLGTFVIGFIQNSAITQKLKHFSVKSVYPTQAISVGMIFQFGGRFFERRIALNMLAGARIVECA